MPKVNFKLGGTLEFAVEESAGYSLVTLRFGSFMITAKGDAMAYTLPVGNAVQVQVAYVDKFGNAATIDGDVTWASSDEDAVAVHVDGKDSTLALVEAKSKTGQAQITATADADLGEGVRELVTFMDVTVIAGEAVAGTIAPVGEPGPVGPQQQR